MENIQTEEESRPLATPRRRVAEAYTTNDRQNNLKKYAFWILTFMAFLIFSLGSGGNGSTKKQRREKKLRNKAETMPEAEVLKQQAINQKVELNDKYSQLNDAHAQFDDSEDASLINGVMEDEEDLDRQVEKVFTDVDMAEEDEIDTNNSMLTSAVKTMEDSVKFYLGKVFGYGDDADEDDDDDDDDAVTSASGDVQLSEEQLDIIAKKISERLESDAKKEFRARADSVKEEKVKEIDKVLAEDRDARMNARDIANDMQETESVVVEDLKDEIDEAASRVKENLPEKVKQIRNEVVEEVTGKKLDDIERKKLAKKEKKKELMHKFQEMQAKAKETQTQKEKLKNTIKEMERSDKKYNSGSEQKYKRDSKGDKKYYPEEKKKYYPEKKRDKRSEVSGSEDEADEESLSDRRRPKPRPEYEESRLKGKKKKKKKYASDNSDDKSADERSADNSNSSEHEKQKKYARSGRRDKFASEHKSDDTEDDE